MTLRIDGKKIQDMSLDEIGATLQQIATELDVRANAAEPSGSKETIMLWAFNQLEEIAQHLRNVR